MSSRPSANGLEFLALGSEISKGASFLQSLLTSVPADKSTSSVSPFFFLSVTEDVQSRTLILPMDAHSRPGQV